MLVSLATACGPRAAIPAAPPPVPLALVATEAQQRLAQALAPVLFLQRDERFRLERVVAVIHPTRPVVAYHLLWRDDVHGAWIPFTTATDQEIVWVGHDGATRATDVWTYWHGRVLHRAVDDSAGTRPAINVQWGKHGSIPRGTTEYDYPPFRSLPTFYMLHWIALPDIWLSNTMRKGPWCFCHSYRRYRDFSRPEPLAGRLDAIATGESPGAVLRATFGKKYSRKRFWPWVQ